MYFQLKKSLPSASATSSVADQPPFPTLSSRGRKRDRSELSSGGDEDGMRHPPIHPSSHPSSPPPPSSAAPPQTSSAASPEYYDRNRASRSRSARARSEDTQQVFLLDTLTGMLQQTLQLQQHIESDRASEVHNERLLAHRYFAQLSLRIDASLYDKYRLEVQKLLDNYV